jgi:hypothetical protein
VSESTPMADATRSLDRWKTLALVLTILTTVFASILAALQTDADIRASKANRDSQALAIVASGELDRGGLAANYELSLLGSQLTDMQQALVFELTALEQQARGEDDLAEVTLVLASAASARVERARQLSLLYTDPRYAPADADSQPDAAAYLADLVATAEELVVQQNAAADDYLFWSRKADSYVTILTVLAVAFFLFGLAQTMRAERLQRFFVLVGSLVLATSVAWSVTVLVS